jgi:protoheme ferro-lyase
VEDGEQVLDPENASSVLHMVLNKINNEFEPMWLDDIVVLLHAHPIPQSPDDHVSGSKD